MIDNSIEYKSIIMRCDKVNNTAFCEVSNNEFDNELEILKRYTQIFKKIQESVIE